MILFLDIDDTLFDSEAAYSFAMQSIGISNDDENYLKARQLTKMNLPVLAPAARSRNLYFKKFLELKKNYSPSQHMQLIEKYEFEVVKHIQRQWQTLNREALLTRLRKRFERIVLISNETLRMQSLKINAIDPNFLLFDNLITSEEVGFEKPHESIFRYALGQTKTDPQNVLMIGDSFKNDILGARNINIKAVKTIEFKNDQEFDPNTVIINDLKDLETIIL